MCVWLQCTRTLISCSNFLYSLCSFFLRILYFFQVSWFYIVNVDTFFYKIGQSTDTLTSDKTYMQIAAIAGAAVYIAMVGGRGTDVWRRSNRLGNRISLMWVTDGRTDDTCVVWRQSNCLHREAGRAALTVSGGKRARARRWLYLERMIMGTHQGHSLTYASASLLYKTIIFLLPPGFLTSRSHTIVNLCSQ